MIHASKIECPQCSAELAAGYVSFGSGLLWHKTRLRGYKRIFFHAFATGEPIAGTWMSSGLMSSVPAMRCNSCGAVVLPHVAPPANRY
ncbi:MAG: PF20097 family protein [Planctomycetota bacterium]|jgi:hypothetical protein